MTLREAIEVIARHLPEVRRPAKKLGLGERLIWTALVLVIYTLMGHTFLYGVPQAASIAARNPLILNIIFAQRVGTLTCLLYTSPSPRDRG